MWEDVLREWNAIEADLQDRGLDVSDRRLLRSRTYRWLRVRIEGLLTVPPVIHYAPTEDGYKLVRIPQTRLGLALDPPEL